MKRIHPSGFQKRSEMAKKKAAAVGNVPKINSFFSTASAEDTRSVASGTALSTQVDTDNNDPELPQFPQTVIKTEIDECLNTASNDSNELNEALDGTGDIPDNNTVNTSQLDHPDSDSIGNVTNVIEVAHDQFYDQEYPSDRGNYDETIVDLDLKRKIVQYGPCQPHINFQPNESGRKFSSDYYSTVTKTGMKIKREWLCYSVKRDTVYCESCWLFSDRQSPNYRSDWISGTNDWQHLSQRIKLHQQSQQHIHAVLDHHRWKRGKCIDDVLDEQVGEEKKQWIKVLHRLIDIVLTLAENNLAFRGDREVINQEHSGNFLALVALVARYDPVLEELVKKPAGSCRYLSPAIQNELISVASSAVKKHVLDEIRGAPFYTVMADGTQDITKHDQVSCVIRYVQLNSERNVVEIKESFLGFFHLIDQSALGIEILLKSILSDVDIKKCRGQGYDGASVMSGKLSGVQKRIKDYAANALYVHCSSHNLNLILCDAAEACVEVKSFFGVIQEIYNYLGSSAPRWAVLHAVGQEICEKLDKKNRNITIKKLCPTR